MIDKNNFEERLSSLHCSDNKPLELYLFMDPLCSDCWTLEPIIKKLQMEYGHYFSLTYVLSGKLSSLNQKGRKSDNNFITLRLLKQKISERCTNEDLTNDSEFPHTPFLASIAIKAAQLQGRRSGVRFIRKLQEYLYFKDENITELNTLINCAKEANIDVNEFQKDIHSDSTSHAFQCDLKITNEMNVTEIPTVVFFSNNAEEEGIKLSGVNKYDIYIEIMREILGQEPENHPLPPLLSFIKHYQFATSKEIAFVYNWPHIRVEMEMKKLMLRQLVDRISSSRGVVWKYTGSKD